MSDALTAFEAALADRPLAWRMPCAACRFMREHDEHYVICRWREMTSIPMPEWAERIDWPRPGQTRGVYTKKELYGPFADDAKQIICPTFLPPAPAADPTPGQSGE